MSTAKKVAVLGGGVGSLSTLASIVAAKDYKQEDWDITVYQEGWRLGGKGASGRNAEVSERIQEHGLHIWLGFYDNAFHLIKLAYESMGEDYLNFFTPTNRVVFQEHIEGNWVPWPIDFPDNAEQPGTKNDLLHPISYAEMILEMLLPMIVGQPYLDKLDKQIAGATKEILEAIDLSDYIEDKIEDLLTDGVVGFLEFLQSLIKKAMKLPEFLMLKLLELIAKTAREVLTAIGEILDVDLNEDTELRRFWIMADMTLTILIGMVEDKVFTKGFGVIDQYDFREWLTKNGGSKYATENPLVQAIYDLIFAYKDGDMNQPSVSAGVALYGAMRMLLTYKGSIFWKMNMGMGDTIFTPFYELLKSKGVKFEFFHKVTNLSYDSNGKEITGIEMQKQVDLADGVNSYDPYVIVHDWQCWPSTPNWEQINQDQATKLIPLQDKRLTLESAWCPWPGVKNFTLKKDTDFDIVLCGISKRPLAEVSSELMGIPAFAAMMNNIQTVTTQAGQLWFNKTSEELGYNPGDPTFVGKPVINGGFEEPYGTVADMTELVPKETWPADQQPKYLAYFCGPMSMVDPAIPPFSDETYPMEIYNQVKNDSWRWLQANGSKMWPNASFSEVSQSSPQLQSEYWRPGNNLTEHYVLSIPGTTDKRIGANDLGVSNLFFAGDWTQNSINAGCVEAGTISGILCAQAITGWDIEVYGMDED